ncbi:Dinucleotide-utilizing enzyme involved in molybdopterin and thiamine biosynthesis ThiF [Methanonatronarchaeum thermophilum]|uniref:Dinucleotide-utilizing enzyme involved in molybdopterin and thiamine biosynthesis ThiF n=1 Tax=Methanonatronarchaeum thermophilum TaxID=1927129 RepID=A0A1Y3GAC8_9EURY|nr:HesA/MoeB/ThiF family protein [Methanonatronarchaeum thermophilum]OUJ18401.1 Dinucleotide-utilizing enzyme involved in molybdopterin and thiamine biosynthesis ThiF [Methanonatronarchaeum thermophilum]
MDILFIFGMTLSESELERYSRQLLVFGEEGQSVLKDLEVVVGGVGGLGSISSIFLVRLGVGRLRVVDSDRVGVSNLNRQALYDDGDVGCLKVEVAGRKLREMNPEVEVEAIDAEVKEDNVSDIIGDADCFVDGFDNMPGRYVVNKECVRREIPFFHASCSGLEGRITTIVPGETACLHCLYQGKDSMDSGPIPVVGFTPAKLAVMQVEQLTRHFLDLDGVLENRLAIFPGDRTVPDTIEIARDLDCDVCSQ